MKTLSVNVDHIATLREARKEVFPDPVHAAVLAELGGADGITCHLRGDRRHIKEEDVEKLKRVIHTELNLEMAATKEMVDIALRIKPHQVTLVPERPEEITTEGGLDLKKAFKDIKEAAKKLIDGGIRLSVFIEAEKESIALAKKLGAEVVELNTNLYSKEIEKRIEILKKLSTAAKYGVKQGLKVHAGHGIDYKNIIPLLSIEEITGFSIGFSIIARAVFTGIKEAVLEMKKIIETHSKNAKRAQS